MEFSVMLVLLQSVFWPEFNHDNFCQNLYFQPNAIEKMEYFYCDIEQTSATIFQVKKG